MLGGPRPRRAGARRLHADFNSNQDTNTEGNADMDTLHDNPDMDPDAAAFSHALRANAGAYRDRVRAVPVPECDARTIRVAGPNCGSDLSTKSLQADVPLHAAGGVMSDAAVVDGTGPSVHVARRDDHG